MLALISIEFRISLPPQQQQPSVWEVSLRPSLEYTTTTLPFRNTPRRRASLVEWDNLRSLTVKIVRKTSWSMGISFRQSLPNRRFSSRSKEALHSWLEQEADANRKPPFSRYFLRFPRSTFDS